MTAKNCGGNVLDEGSTIRHRRLRAPKDHGQILQAPALSQAEQIWQHNLSLNLNDAKPKFVDLVGLSQMGRHEIVQLAQSYSGQYLDVDLEGRDRSKIVMSGHQPALFHPGVWFKNFALSVLADRFSAIGINLIVDNDICGLTSIRAPQLASGNAKVDSIPFDSPGENIPFEERRIVDGDMFQSFGTRCRKSIKEFTANPIVEDLWPFAIELQKQFDKVGAIIAAARHRYEASHGTKTLEVPISLLSGSNSFAMFCKEILFRLPEFQDIYNSSLEEYRRVHKIRSRSHPVPPLEQVDEIYEAPFWIWTSEHPARKRLFVRLSEKEVELTDRDKVSVALNRSNFTNDFKALASSNIKIRPRALITTMYSRVVLSDLFIHGIGGAKYDQLTDAIVQRFLNLSPRQFLTLSATFHLAPNEAKVSPGDIKDRNVQLREFRFHPETHIENRDEIESQLTRKREWIAKDPPRGSRKERHENIDAANREMEVLLTKQKAKLQNEIQSLDKKIRESQITGSREYSFCLFPKELPETLSRLARDDSS